MNALHYACITSDHTIVTSVIGALGNQAIYAACALNRDQWNALHYACKHGDSTMVANVIQALDNKAADAAFAQMHYQANALHFACLKGDISVIQLIIEILALPLLNSMLNQVNKDGENPINIAEKNGYSNIVDLLQHQQKSKTDLKSATRASDELSSLIQASSRDSIAVKNQEGKRERPDDNEVAVSESSIKKSNTGDSDGVTKSSVTFFISSEDKTKTGKGSPTENDKKRLREADSGGSAEDPEPTERNLSWPA